MSERNEDRRQQVKRSQQKLYQQRRDAGLCVQCGVDAAGKSKCAGCLAKDVACRAARIARRKQEGRCQNSGCLLDAMKGKTVCKSCSAKATATKLASYYDRKEAGVCRYCGEESDGKSRCETCAEAFAKYSEAWYWKQREAGICVNCADAEAEPDRIVCAACYARRRQAGASRWLRLKLAAINAYGGPVCVGCGEDDADILEIDHIDGGGTKHRREIGQSRMYIWLKQNNYPTGYRVLCPTCNKKAHRGKKLPNDTQE